MLHGRFSVPDASLARDPRGVSPVALDPSPGELFAGDYEVVAPLASGGMGSVWVVSQRSTGERRALKIMRVGLGDPESRARFDREARISALIQSAHVVKVVQAGIDEATGVPWLVMELLQGEDLATRVARAPLSFAELSVLLEQVCHALGLAHDVPIVHRDLKPENLFLAVPQSPGVPFTAKVLDFGIAKMTTGPSGDLARTASLGTPLWMAPEQADAVPEITPSTDVWALGLVAFHALTGRVFWKAANVPSPVATAVVSEVLAGAIPPASERARELGVGPLPEAFDAWFARCVARAKGERFRDAREAGLAFASHVAGSASALGLSATVPLAGLSSSVRPAPPSAAELAATAPLEAAPGATPPSALGATPPPPLGATAAPPRRRSIAPFVVAVVLVGAVGGLGPFAWKKRETHRAEGLAASAQAAGVERARSLRAKASADSLSADKKGCLALLDEADRLDPAGAPSTPEDVRARCEMAAGRCEAGRKRYRDFIQHDPRVPPISVDAMVRTTTGQSCPWEQLQLDERIQLVASDTSTAWSAGDVAACQAGAARAVDLLAEVPKDATDKTPENTALSAIQVASGCLARAGRCDEAKVLHRKYTSLAPYLRGSTPAELEQSFYATNPTCPPPKR